MEITAGLSLAEKLKILSDAAKYDVACTSSGVERRGEKGTMGSASAAGICHSFSADGRCISLLKILMTNVCVYDCKYCINRCTNDVPRTTFTPDEICRLTMEFYRRNYIEGLFLSSGVLKNPTYTMSKMYEAIWKLRNEHRFRGYIHVKGIPGADPALIEQMGFLADRMSINLELPTSEGLRTLAPNKTRRTILTPMRQIQRGIRADQENRLGAGSGVPRLQGGNLLPDEEKKKIRTFDESTSLPAGYRLASGRDVGYVTHGKKSSFVPAGQSTQMIIGATPESDYQLIRVAQALYRGYDLKRVFYSAFIRLNEDPALPDTPQGPPLLREHRLYQADWLMRFYGFEAEELLSEEQPNFNVLLDPKCDWALRHLELFPVEVTRADYYLLLRVPGIGVKSARRIVAARKRGRLDFDALKKMGVVLKRAHYFITCAGKQLYPTAIEQNYITNRLIEDDRRKNWEIEHRESYRQLSLFDDMHLDVPPQPSDAASVRSGQF